MRAALGISIVLSFESLRLTYNKRPSPPLCIHRFPFARISLLRLSGLDYQSLVF